MYQKGFTFIELLILITIIAILLTVVFIVLDPFTRFKDSRDATRWQDVTAILDGIKKYQEDNNGLYPSVISDMDIEEVYMITDGAFLSGCNAQNIHCDINVAESTNCLDLSGLVAGGYLEKVPVSSNGDGTWSSSVTGYTLQRNSNGIITVRACESENIDEIWIAR